MLMEMIGRGKQGGTKKADCGEKVLVDKVYSLLNPILQSMVDHPDEIDLSILCGTKLLIAEVMCNDADRKYLIGAHGRNADGLRVTLASITARHGYLFSLNIVEGKK